MLFGGSDSFVREGCGFLQKESRVILHQVHNLHCNGFHCMVVGCQIFPGYALDVGIWLTLLPCNLLTQTAYTYLSSFW
ncbi:hypothetical protein GW17_00042455 [Ensete ventricosum]|nr:hypothetical protein GW17_00042455 [Ensete ventricosum]